MEKENGKPFIWLETSNPFPMANKNNASLITLCLPEFLSLYTDCGFMLISLLVIRQIS